MRRLALAAVSLGACIALTGPALAQKSDAELIAEARTAAPPVITDNATFKTPDGRMLKEGTNDWTCYPGSPALGPMCNQETWDAMIAALMNQQPFEADRFSVSYMLVGDKGAPGVSNIDPYATEPTPDNDWIKEGPHLMIAVPDPAMLEGLSTDPSDPVYVMWKGTPYAHIMVKLNPEG